MQPYAYIQETCRALVERHGTRDPLALAEAEGIHLYPRHNFQNLRGMYLLVNGWRCLFYKADLSEKEIAEVVAHELGHAFLHEDYLDAGQEFIDHNQYYDPRSKLEREANFFAAELLIPDADFYAAIEEGEELKRAAAILGYNPNLLLFKAELLKSAGHRVNVPFLPSNDYLAR